MGTAKRCDRCYARYTADEAPGPLCPLCQARTDARPELIALGLAIAAAALAFALYGH